MALALQLFYRRLALPRSLPKLAWWFTQSISPNRVYWSNKTRKYLVQPHAMQIVTQKRQKYIYQQILLVELQNGFLNRVSRRNFCSQRCAPTLPNTEKCSKLVRQCLQIQFCLVLVELMFRRKVISWRRKSTENLISFTLKCNLQQPPKSDSRVIV